MRKQLVPATIAAALAAKARRSLQTGIPLYLPAFDDRFRGAPELEDAEDPEVDASGLTIGGDEDDDSY